MEDVTRNIISPLGMTMPGEHSLSSPNLPRDKSYYKCRKCRCILFSSDYIVNAHGKQMDTEEFTTCSALSKDQTVAYLRDALPPWIEDLIHEANWIKGKIMCPKCNGRLGSFDFVSGTKCPCGQYVLPAVHVVNGKIDWENQTVGSSLVCSMSDEVIEKHETETLKEHQL